MPHSSDAYEESAFGELGLGNGVHPGDRRSHVGERLAHEGRERASCRGGVVIAKLETGHKVTVYARRGVVVCRRARRRAGDGAPMAAGIVLTVETEGLMWVRGWRGKFVDAFQVAVALESAEPRTVELPLGWTSDTYAIRLGP